MQLPPIIKQLDEKLQGWPDSALTLGLIAGAIIIVLIALLGPPVLKATVLAWIIAP